MQLTLTPVSPIKQNAKVANVSKNTKTKDSIQSSNTFQLPGYNQVDKNFPKVNLKKPSFGSAANEILLKEIKLLEREKAGLFKETADEVVQAAKERIAKFEAWNEDEVKKKAETEATEAGRRARSAHISGHGGLWQFFHGDGSDQYDNAHWSKMYHLFEKPKEEINKIEEGLHSDKKIVELHESNEEQKAKRLEEIEKAIITKKKLIDFQSLQDGITTALNAKGGVNEIIAGYHNVKDELKRVLMEPLKKSMSDPDIELPGCIILYGPTGTGKSTFLEGIKEQCKDFAVEVPLTEHQGKTDFHEIVKKELKKAKERYINTGKRTIMTIDDAEQVMSMTKEQARTKGINVDESDETLTEAYGNNAKFISQYKAMAKLISKTPKEGDHPDSFSSATTFFITTNYPHLIDQDIMSRNEKAYKIAVGLASDKNLTDVLEFNFDKHRQTLANIKGLKHNTSYREGLDNISGLPDKAKENIKKTIAQGTVDKFDINTEEILNPKLVQFLNPNSTKGAYGNDQLKDMANEAFLHYLTQNPAESSFFASFRHIIQNTGRSINPSRLERFNTIDRMIVKSNSLDKETTQISEKNINELLEDYNNGLLEEKDKKVLNYRISEIETELKSLINEESLKPLTKEKLARKIELEELQRKINKSKETSD